MKTSTDIYSMKLHDIGVANDGNNFIEVLRVAGGWLYITFDKSHQLLGTAFVPYHNEFQCEKPVIFSTVSGDDIIPRVDEIFVKAMDLQKELKHPEPLQDVKEFRKWLVSHVEEKLKEKTSEK